VDADETTATELVLVPDLGVPIISADSHFV
jgi:hypothetical protein